MKNTKMLIYDVLHKEKVYEIVTSDLRNFGVKYRLKKNAIKTEKSERSGNALKKIFKNHLIYLPLDVVNLSSGAIIHVPAFVSQACTFLEKYITQEGLFRKAGSHVRQKELIMRLENGGTFGEKHQAIDIASSLKTFFRDLPEPLIPFPYHDLFLRCALLKSRRIEALLLACILLPPQHLNTLAFFMEFLKKVSYYEKQNKMGVDNLSKVIGPNIMPLQETTMLAVQSRLETHLIIVKILIENAERIGVLPVHITDALSAEAMGSTENELDRSDTVLHFKYKKKKRRSGSLTRKPHLSASNLNLRMFNGLKKMVGKSGSPVDSTTNNQLLTADSSSLHTPSVKTGKKRKVIEPTGPLSVKRKRDLLEVMPDNTCLRPRHLFASPVSNDPNPVKEKSPVYKSKVRKYLSHKIHSETAVGDKLDKPKRIRLSLDRLVSRSKQKIADTDTDFSKNSGSPRIERRWSSVNTSSGSKKKRRTQSDELLCLTSPLNKDRTVKNAVQKDYDQIFMNADVNLSDDSDEQSSQKMVKLDHENRIKHTQTGSNRRSLDTMFASRSTNNCNPEYLTNSEQDPKVLIHCNEFMLDCNESSQTCLNSYTGDSTKSTTKDQEEEYVRIPKSEYEEIKNRVSAIESRISQEFGCISSNTTDSLSVCSASKVQSEYEKTLEEAGIENIVTADHLAKRLSKELKIRRSSEHKIIRSPSARKIGILRRRSQDKPNSKRTSSNTSWHISDKSDQYHAQSNVQLNNYYPQSELRPNIGSDSICSDETNSRLNFLQEQLRTLITHTVEHTRGSLSDDDMNIIEDELFEPTKCHVRSTVRRASSFHGNEFIDNSRYFNKKIKELKKSNSQQNVTLNNDRFVEGKTYSETRTEKTITWKDANGYFKSDGQIRTPALQTGRASIAKLRTQNAGMVLAKAKLFDENLNARQEFMTDKKVDQQNASKKSSVKVSRPGEVQSLDLDVTTPNSRKVGVSRRKHSKSPKNNSAKLKLVQLQDTTPLTKMELTIVPSQNALQTMEKRSGRRNSQRFDQQNLELATSNLKLGQVRTKHESRDVKACQSSAGLYRKENRFVKSPSSIEKLSINTPLQETNTNIYNPDISAMCKTPHIKKSLTIKTPKSSRSLARKPGVDSRRTPMKAVATLGTPKRQSPKSVLKSRHLTRRIN